MTRAAIGVLLLGIVVAGVLVLTPMGRVETYDGSGDCGSPLGWPSDGDVHRSETTSEVRSECGVMAVERLLGAAATFVAALLIALAIWVIPLWFTRRRSAPT